MTPDKMPQYLLATDLFGT